LARDVDDFLLFHAEDILSSIDLFVSLERKIPCVRRLYLEVSSQCISLSSIQTTTAISNSGDYSSFFVTISADYVTPIFSIWFSSLEKAFCSGY
jgi:hypothetical protein